MTEISTRAFLEDEVAKELNEPKSAETKVFCKMKMAR